MNKANNIRYRFSVVDTANYYTLYISPEMYSDVSKARRAGYRFLRLKKYPKSVVLRFINI